MPETIVDLIIPSEQLALSDGFSNPGSIDIFVTDTAQVVFPPFPLPRERLIMERCEVRSLMDGTCVYHCAVSAGAPPVSYGVTAEGAWIDPVSNVTQSRGVVWGFRNWYYNPGGTTPEDFPGMFEADRELAYLRDESQLNTALNANHPDWAATNTGYQYFLGEHHLTVRGWPAHQFEPEPVHYTYPDGRKWFAQITGDGLEAVPIAPFFSNTLNHVFPTWLSWTEKPTSAWGGGSHTVFLGAHFIAALALVNADIIADFSVYIRIVFWVRLVFRDETPLPGEPGPTHATEYNGMTALAWWGPVAISDNTKQVVIGWHRGALAAAGSGMGSTVGWTTYSLPERYGQAAELGLVYLPDGKLLLTVTDGSNHYYRLNAQFGESPGWGERMSVASGDERFRDAKTSRNTIVWKAKG